MIDPLIALRAIMSATTVDQVHYAAWLAHEAVGRKRRRRPPVLMVVGRGASEIALVD
jgi:hypothetical protein